MVIKPLMSGISMGITAGTLAFTIARSTAKQKKKLKTKAGKALQAVGDFVDGISDMLK